MSFEESLIVLLGMYHTWTVSVSVCGRGNAVWLFIVHDRTVYPFKWANAPVMRFPTLMLRSDYWQSDFMKCHTRSWVSSLARKCIPLSSIVSPYNLTHCSPIHADGTLSSRWRRSNKYVRRHSLDNLTGFVALLPRPLLLVWLPVVSIGRLPWILVHRCLSNYMWLRYQR